MAPFREQQHPFYKPLWRRVAIVAIVAVWFAVEIVRNSGPMWVMIAGGFLAYSVYMFFITWPKEEGAKDEAPKDDAPPPA